MFSILPEPGVVIWNTSSHGRGAGHVPSDNLKKDYFTACHVCSNMITQFFCSGAQGFAPMGLLTSL